VGRHPPRERRKNLRDGSKKKTKQKLRSDAGGNKIQVETGGRRKPNTGQTDGDDTLRAGLTRTTSLEERETQAKQNLRCFFRTEIHCPPSLHVSGVDRTRRHSTSRSTGHRVSDMCDNLRSSTLGLLLLPRSSLLHDMSHLPHAHYETSKRDSPNETKVKKIKRNYPGFEFKHR
jgi:hypothetical protein